MKQEITLNGKDYCVIGGAVLPLVLRHEKDCALKLDGFAFYETCDGEEKAAVLAEVERRRATPKPLTLDDVVAVQPLLKQFIGKSQWRAVAYAMRGEERQFFYDMMVKLAATISAMPKTYEQQDKGGDAVVHLHYFSAGCDWWILEKDSDPDGEGQAQAFGYACLNDPQNAELGYISIKELVEANVELDFYWKPVTLATVRAKVEG